MNYKGNNIVGDDKYKKRFKKIKNINVDLERSLIKLNRQFLHAKTIGFIHPKTGMQLEFDSDLPKDLLNIVKKLRNTNK